MFHPTLCTTVPQALTEAVLAYQAHLRPDTQYGKRGKLRLCRRALQAMLQPRIVPGRLVQVRGCGLGIIYGQPSVSSGLVVVVVVVVVVVAVVVVVVAVIVVVAATE